MFKKGENPNHPDKGCSLRTDPIREPRDIEKIKRRLAKEKDPRNLMLFILGINFGLRISDLIKLRVEDVKYLDPGETLSIREQKTKKQQLISINENAYRVIQDYIKFRNPDNNAWLFPSRKNRSQHLTTIAASNLVKGWCSFIKKRDGGRYSSHSLRKTWAYQNRINFNVGWEVITKKLNHAGPAVTMRYLGIQDREVKEAEMNCI
jgi:Site-specific recombinase XerC